MAPLIDTNGYWLISVYLVGLLIIGILGRVARKSNSLGDFFLANRSFGFFVLFLTLYATQYSGNTLIGFPATAYRNGFNFLSSVTFMMGVIAIYCLYAPNLYTISKSKNFITLADYIYERYRSRKLAVLISISGMVALINFLVTNLKAMGEVAVKVTDGQLGYAEGIIILALIIIIYETLGGLRSVAWTDVLQGIMLFIGCIAIFSMIVVKLGGFAEIATQLHTIRPEFWEPPKMDSAITWLSTLIVVSLGIAMYPHAIQRIYAAKSYKSLRIALTIMVFMPLLTTLLMVSIGILANIKYQGLTTIQSEGITLLILKDVIQSYPSLMWLVVLFVGAVLAAIMSTADSALLSLASSVTKDLFQPTNKRLSQVQLTLIGKTCSWGIMAIATCLAILLPQNIWTLIQIKLELLIQCAPALLLGLHLKHLKASAVLSGLIVGIVITVGHLIGTQVFELFPSKPFGLHAGLWALFANLATVGIVAQISDKLKQRS